MQNEDDSRQSEIEVEHGELTETVKTPRKTRFEVLTPILMDVQHYATPCSGNHKLGALAPQLVAVWSARFMRALMYFHCF